MTRNKHTFVLDTNVLLYDPKALEVFDEHDIVIPMTVLEEIDKFKRDMNETGRNAREASRRLDLLRQQGSLREGVTLPSGATVRVGFPGDHDEDAITWGVDNNDNRILQLALALTARQDGRVVLVTRDTNMRLKADALGMHAEDYEHSRLHVAEQYSGTVERTVDADVLAALYADGRVETDEAEGLYPNEFAVLRAEDDEHRTAMARVLPDRRGFRLVGRHKDGAWGVIARNKEQLFGLDLLLDPDVTLVTLNGVAGTGKTLLAIAAALKQTADQKLYRKVLVSRPVFPLGRDIGFLPGTLGEKLNPWMQPIFDNLDYLLSSRPSDRRRSQEPEYQYLLDSKLVEVEALTYIRGRSIPGQFLIIDEAQNLTPHEVKTVLTRAGEGTKVVLTGDPFQIDNPYVDEVSNGLTYAVERFKESPVAGHVTLKKGERSQLAELAARLL